MEGLRDHKPQRTERRITGGHRKNDNSDYRNDTARITEHIFTHNSDHACGGDFLHYAVNTLEITPAALGHLHGNTRIFGTDPDDSHGTRSPNHRDKALAKHHIVESHPAVFLAL